MTGFSGHHASVSILRRAAAPLLLIGAAAITVTVPVVLIGNAAVKELPWVLGTVVFLAAAALVLRRRPEAAIGAWFAASAGLVALVQTLDGIVLRVGTTADPVPLAWLMLLYHLVSALAGIVLAHLFGLFPDGQVRRRYERVVLRSLWWVLALPLIAFISRPTLLIPSYHQLPDVANPYHVSGLGPVGEVAGTGVVLLQGIFIVGAALLVPRYRRASTADQRRIRWLLPPVLFAAAVAVIDLVAWRAFPDGAPSVAAEVGLTILWVLVISALPIGVAIGVLRPRLLDVDRVIRRSLTYGLLWSLIAATYVAVAAGLGMAAGQRFPLGLAIALTVVATLFFQPARKWLERMADRWVFGERSDPARVIAELGATLEETLEIESLLPRMADTLQEGLGLRWARVSLEPAYQASVAEGNEPVLVVPIHLGEERLGVVECGPKRSGAFTEEDEALVETLARQAALAVRNVRLTAELEASRARLVRAQEAERRRLERNIHDGVQQDLVALMGQAARIRTQFEPGATPQESALAELQSGLKHVLAELRELAHGIHPSVLSDRGLLAAVEALAGRSAIPVSVRADPTLCGARFVEEVEGAGYFTVAEALANAGKHAEASQIDVSLARDASMLRITVTDDGGGFDVALAFGDGLANLAERLAALGGNLDVASEPGRGTTISARIRVADA